VWPTDGGSVRAVGVSVPFSPSPDGNVITGGPNMPGWHNVQLHDILREQLGTDIYIGNDANIAAIAEATMGAARGYRDVIFLTISTGIALCGPDSDSLDAVMANADALLYQAKQSGRDQVLCAGASGGRRRTATTRCRSGVGIATGRGAS